MNADQSHYWRLRRQLEADITAAWGTPLIYFGQPSASAKGQRATVRVARSRARSGRQVYETWSFSIWGSWATGWEVRDGDGYLDDQANLLILRLAPYDEDAIPEVSPDYAGIGFNPKVTEVRYIDGTTDDPARGVLVEFTITTKVYQ
ncbi:MAG: hypothetical protein EON58_02015 [Alphaproteobacteria bacterium]|nr:MAG: hypothetical protein EON58_02015 [Alphaproteobacteria bacterium]